jgi:hypothetical protein
MLRLTVLGTDSSIGSSLCASCPHSPAGCCVAPPPLSFADLGRIVSLGGRDWLLHELSRGNLTPHDRGLQLRRRKGRAHGDARGAPRVSKCVFHGPGGCTIAHSQRSATCNLYICDSALHQRDADRQTSRDARALHGSISAQLIAITDRLRARLRDECPEGPTYDASFFDWLGNAFLEIRARPCWGDVVLCTTKSAQPPRARCEAQVEPHDS